MQHGQQPELGHGAVGAQIVRETLAAERIPEGKVIFDRQGIQQRVGLRHIAHQTVERAAVTECVHAQYG